MLNWEKWAKIFQILRESGWRKVLRKILLRWTDIDYRNLYSTEALYFSIAMDCSSQQITESRKIHETFPGKFDIQSITWFLPEFKHVYYGGIYTILRFADYLNREKGIRHRFVVLGQGKEQEIAGRIRSVFPALSNQPVKCVQQYEHLETLQPTDAAIATFWTTAYFLLRFNKTQRKFYFMQDYEPTFYPTGSVYALVEATYRFGFYGLTNTPALRQIYEQQYGGQAEYFVPCVDTNVFFPAARLESRQTLPVKLFFYGRPSFTHKGFELGIQALRLIKKRLGNQIQIVTAGETWNPKQYDLEGIVESLGLLDFYETAELYRTCPVSLILVLTRHPSYLPFELMASGSLVVANYNQATEWFFRDYENCLLSEASASCLAEKLEEAVLNPSMRETISGKARSFILNQFQNWEKEMEKIFQYMVTLKKSLE
jgi:glycosyltransferase involved in cell wall biosynthesis